MFGADSNAGAAVFDCFDCVFDLKVAAVGGEDRIGEVITCPYRGLQEIRVSAMELWQNLGTRAYHDVEFGLM
jgi:hypothetical protein